MDAVDKASLFEANLHYYAEMLAIDYGNADLIAHVHACARAKAETKVYDDALADAEVYKEALAKAKAERDNIEDENPSGALLVFFATVIAPGLFFLYGILQSFLPN